MPSRFRRFKDWPKDRRGVLRQAIVRVSFPPEAGALTEFGRRFLDDITAGTGGTDARRATARVHRAPKRRGGGVALPGRSAATESPSPPRHAVLRQPADGHDRRAAP